MTEHPHQLYAIDFTEADQERLVGFSCGTEDWSRAATEWILGSDALEALKRGNRVWLFETTDGTIVGFGSLGTTSWRWPPPRGKESSPVVLIPMLGIEIGYRGVPAEQEWRYSRQIMSHLIAEASRLVREWKESAGQRPEWLVLMVHRDNTRAIRAYERCGFEIIRNNAGNPAERKAHILMKLWVGD